MIARDLIEALLPHDLTKKVYFVVEMPGHDFVEVEVHSVSVRNEQTQGRATKPRLVLHGDDVRPLIETKIKLEAGE